MERSTHRTHIMRHCLCVLGGTVCLWAIVVSGWAQNMQPVWYRGNLHSHTINSDGDSPPYDVVAWYKRNGYQFLALTDHNTFTDPALFDTNPADNFLLIGAEEITNERTVHVNALGIKRAIPPQKGATVTEILQASIDAVRAVGAVPLINHPNFFWAFTAREMLPLQNAGLLEIATGFPVANTEGDGQAPSAEQMWDQLLSAGKRIFAAAVDDSHNFRQEFTMDRASPGRAWVSVRARELTQEAIVAALNSGDFYASTGVILRDVRPATDSLTVEIQPDPPSERTGRNALRFRTVFIGKEGAVLATSNDNPAVYQFKGSEGYVRARVEDSNGHRAWTQPVFLNKQ